MSIEGAGAPALDYQPCRFGQSRLVFRGPLPALSGDHVAVLGGSETYGRFVAEPFPVLLGHLLGLPVVNFGCMNAGLDAFLNEPDVTEACRSARATILQVVGAGNMTNRFYAVHPRRNDRFLKAFPIMQAMFGEIDFAEYNFTRHMLTDLRRRAPERFMLLEAELKAAWLERMRQLVARLGRKTVLLWIACQDSVGRRGDGLGPAPLLVDGGMVAAVAPLAGDLVRVEPSAAARRMGTEGMVFSALELPAAAELPGPAVHAEIARALEPVLRNRL